LLAMTACIVCSANEAIAYSLTQWEKAIPASYHQLPQQAITAGIFLAKTMTILMGVLLPLAFLAILGFYYRRINPTTWR
jgi:MFS superfamily sulfate permease-like transporter